MLTYGDGVSNLNIRDLVKFHEINNTQATMTKFNLQEDLEH